MVLDPSPPPLQSGPSVAVRSHPSAAFTIASPMSGRRHTLCIYTRHHMLYIHTLAICGHTATHCNTLQHNATHCNTMHHMLYIHTLATCGRHQCVAVCCSVLQCVAHVVYPHTRYLWRAKRSMRCESKSSISQQQTHL